MKTKTKNCFLEWQKVAFINLMENRLINGFEKKYERTTAPTRKWGFSASMKVKC